MATDTFKRRRVIRDTIIPAIGDTIEAGAGTAIAVLQAGKELAEAGRIMARGVKSDTELEEMEDEIHRAVERARILEYRSTILNDDGTLKAQPVIQAKEGE